MDDINNNLQNEVDGKSDNNSSDEDEVFFSTYLYLMIYLIHCGLFRLELSFLLLLFCSTRLTKSRTGSNCPLFQTQCYITHFSPMFHFYTLETSENLCFAFALNEKCPNTEFFLVRIFLYLDQKKLRAWALFKQCWLN